jgi:hypothetical protein
MLQHESDLAQNDIKMSHRNTTRSGATGNSSTCLLSSTSSNCSCSRFTKKTHTTVGFFMTLASLVVCLVIYSSSISLQNSSINTSHDQLLLDVKRSSFLDDTGVLLKMPLLKDQSKDKADKNTVIKSAATMMAGSSFMQEQGMVRRVGKNKAATVMEKMSLLHFQEGTASSCKDPKRLMPLCESCIPGLLENVKTKECELDNATKSIRSQLFHIASQRGARGTCQVYKYLSTETLQQRHKYAAKVLDAIAPKRVLDIGSYTSPIVSFMSSCPETVFMIEPCGELSNKFGSEPWLSKQITCDTSSKITKIAGMTSGKTGDDLYMTHHMVAPTSIKTFLYSRHFQHFDAVVCIGCDKNFGPTWDELMSMPRPFHLILEFSRLAFTGDYPTEDQSGCSVKDVHDFDFSDCPDCEYNIRKSMSQYGKQRKLIVFHCKEYPQDKEKETLSKQILSDHCNNVKKGTYFEVACQSENMLFHPNISDNALIAINATTALEKSDMDLLTQEMVNNKKFKGDCVMKRYQQAARAWWDTNQHPKKYMRALSNIRKTKEIMHDDIFEAMCTAGLARNLLSAAEPQERIIDNLHDIIRTYQMLLKVVIQQEPAHKLPYRFPLKTCPPFLDQEYLHEVAEMEPIFPDGRNLDLREYGSTISFSPYRPLVSFETVKLRSFRRCILIDVGANGFTASPKQLMDNYAALGMPFDEVVMFEPDIDGMKYIPDIYKNGTKIHFHQQYIKVGTRSIENDVLTWIKKNVHKDDFLVLKFDVDEKSYGPTIEWGFLGDLLYSDALNLVDEYYTELHYYSNFGWRHNTHSSRQRYDVMRQLRACGMAIHEWP